jgi:hypothetical protein
VLGLLDYIPDLEFPWFHYPLIFWGVGVLAHYFLGVVLLSRWLKKEPEVAEIQEIMVPRVFRPNYSRLQQMYNRLVKSREGDASTDEKKKALEELSEYLLSCLEGFECIDRDRRVADHEVDRIFRNTNTADPLLSTMGPFIMVECKNLAEPVSTRDLGHFINGLQVSGAKFGIFMSASGFSGIRRGGHVLADCAVTLRDAKRAGVIVLPIDMSDLEDIVSRRKNLVDVFWDKYYMVTTL